MRTLNVFSPAILSRRFFIAGAALALTGIGIRTTQANAIIGKAVEITGDVTRKQAERLEGLKAGASLMDHDFVKTGKGSFASLELGDDTSLLLGSETELLIDTFIAGQGGVIELGTGQMVFDRPEGLAKIDLTVRTAFGMIGVRGTKFFAGPQPRCLRRLRRAWPRGGLGRWRHAAGRARPGRRDRLGWCRARRNHAMGRGPHPRGLCERRDSLSKSSKSVKRFASGNCEKLIQRKEFHRAEATDFVAADGA
jgi:hypothetical protein